MGLGCKQGTPTSTQHVSPWTTGGELTDSGCGLILRWPIRPHPAHRPIQNLNSASTSKVSHSQALFRYRRRHDARTLHNACYRSDESMYRLHRYWPVLDDMPGQIFAAGQRDSNREPTIISLSYLRAELASCDASAKVATCRRGDPHSNVTGHFALLLPGSLPRTPPSAHVSCKMMSSLTKSLRRASLQLAAEAEMTLCETLILQLATLSQSFRNPFTILSPNCRFFYNCHCLDT